MEQCSVHTTDHASVNWDNVCSYDFILEQFNETCSKRKRKKKGVFGSFFCVCMSSVHSITWGQSNPPIICVFWNTTGPKGGNQTRVSTNDITHRLGGKVILPSGTLQRSLHQNHIQGGLRHLYYTSWHIYTAEYAAKRLHVLFLWCKVFEKKIGIFFLKRADFATPEFPAAERNDLKISPNV